MTIFKIFNLPDKIGTDKLIHLIVCYGITLLMVFVGSQFTDPANFVAPGALIAFVAGLGKECYDKIKNNNFDSIDLVFDVIGLALAAFAMLMVL